MVATVETGGVNHQIVAGGNSLLHPNGFIIVVRFQFEIEGLQLVRF